jgi:hypothetical protein
MNDIASRSMWGENVGASNSQGDRGLTTKYSGDCQAL